MDEKRIPVVIGRLTNVPVGFATILDDGTMILRIESEKVKEELLQPEAKVLSLNYGIKQIKPKSAEDKNQARMDDPEALLQ